MIKVTNLRGYNTGKVVSINPRHVIAIEPSGDLLLILLSTGREYFVTAEEAALFE